jgi:hypothetical protein
MMNEYSRTLTCNAALYLIKSNEYGMRRREEASTARKQKSDCRSQNAEVKAAVTGNVYGATFNGGDIQRMDNGDGYRGSGIVTK